MLIRARPRCRSALSGSVIEVRRGGFGVGSTKASVATSAIVISTVTPKNGPRQLMPPSSPPTSGPGDDRALPRPPAGGEADDPADAAGRARRRAERHDQDEARDQRPLAADPARHPAGHQPRPRG